MTGLPFPKFMPARLVNGVGAPQTGGCWMSTLCWVFGKDWTDNAHLEGLVDPIIRGMCVNLNDACRDDAERAERIFPHLFQPAGTYSADPDIRAKRKALYLEYNKKRDALTIGRFIRSRDEAEALRKELLDLQMAWILKLCAVGAKAELPDWRSDRANELEKAKKFPDPSARDMFVNSIKLDIDWSPIENCNCLTCVQAKAGK